MLKKIIKLANDLDARGFVSEADALDEIILEAQEKESLTDIAVRQEKERKWRAAAEKEYQKLLESAGWFSENIWKSKADKFPVETPELYIGVKWIFWDPSQGPERTAVRPETVIFPEGTVFDDMTSKKPTKGGGSISLGEAGSLLEKSLAETRKRLGE